MPGALGGGKTKVEQSSRPLTEHEYHMLGTEKEKSVLQLGQTRKAIQTLNQALRQAGAPGEVMRNLRQAMGAAAAEAESRLDLTGAGDVGLQQLGSVARHQTGLAGQAGSNLLRTVGAGPSLTGQQRRDIRTSADLAIAAGRSDIETGFQEGLTAIRNILAPRRGLRPTDTPIVDRAGDLFKERMRQEGQLIRGVRGQAAQQRLDYPLAAFQAGTSRRGIDTGLVGQTMQTGMGVAGMLGQQGEIVRNNALALREALAKLPLNLSSQKAATAAGMPWNPGALGLTRGGTSSQSNPMGSNIPQIASGVGSLMLGMAML